MELKDALEEDIMELKDDLEEEDIMELKDALEEDIMELKNDLEEALPPLKIVEETVIEDLSVPEIIAQEVIIKDGSITTIGAGPYNGFIQSPTAVRVPAFIAAIREDGEILSKSIIPIPLPASGDIPVPTAVSNRIEEAMHLFSEVHKSPRLSITYLQTIQPHRLPPSWASPPAPSSPLTPSPRASSPSAPPPSPPASPSTPPPPTSSPGRRAAPWPSPSLLLAPLPSPLLAASRLAGELTSLPFWSFRSLSEPMPLLDCSSS